MKVMHGLRFRALQGARVSSKNPSRVWDRYKGVAGRNRWEKYPPRWMVIYLPSRQINDRYFSWKENWQSELVCTPEFGLCWTEALLSFWHSFLPPRLLAPQWFSTHPFGSSGESCKLYLQWSPCTWWIQEQFAITSPPGCWETTPIFNPIWLSLSVIMPNHIFQNGSIIHK